MSDQPKPFLKVSDNLSLEEYQALRAVNLSPRDFCVLEVSADGMQLASGPDPRRPGHAAVIAIFHVALPKELLNLPTHGLIGADGQEIGNTRLQQAFAGAGLRLILKKEILSGKGREQMTENTPADGGAE